MGLVRNVHACFLGQRAQRRATSRQFDAGLRLARQARRLFLAEHDNDLSRRHVAATWMVEGECLNGLGQYDSAVDAYQQAVELLRRDVQNAEALGRCLVDYAIEMHDLSPATAIELLVEAREVLLPFGKQYQREVDLFIDELGDFDEDAGDRWRSAVERARQHRSTASDELARARAAHREARLLVVHGDRSDIASGLALLETVIARNLAARDHELLFDCLVPIIEASIRTPCPLDDPVSGRLVTLCREILGIAGQDRMHHQVARAKLALGAALSLAEGPRSGLGVVLEALVETDDAAASTVSTFGRWSVSRRTDGARGLALHLATALDEARLVAELVETSRPQTLPVGESAAADSIRRSWQGEIRELALTPARDVTIEGRSALAEARRRSTAGSPLPLEDAIVAIAGPNGWWWGTSLGINRCMYWATRSPDGTYQCGRIDLDADGAVQRLIDSLPGADDDAGPGGDRSLDRSRRQGSPDLMWQAGRELVPPPLLEAISAAKDLPISLAIGSNFLGDLPLAAFGVQGSGDQRLVDRVCIRLMPPCVLVEAMLSEYRAAPDIHPVLLACNDPYGDLPHARHPALPARVTLTHSSNLESWPEALPATRDQLLKHLNPTITAEPGVLFYAGHVVEGLVGDDEETALLLEDGPLLAIDLFDSAAVAMPTRVLLAACSSSGAAGAGRGEWLGLTAVAAAKGTTHAVATSWPVPDCQYTHQFEEDLVWMLQTAKDPAAGLRDLQLTAMAAWRGVNAPRAWIEMRASRDHSSPLVWAAFQCVGLYPAAPRDEPRRPSGCGRGGSQATSGSTETHGL